MKPLRFIILTFYIIHFVLSGNQPTMHKKQYFSICYTFTWYPDCAVDQPDKRVSMNPTAASTSCFGRDVLCAWKCQRDPSCLEFNLHSEAQTCDLYYSTPKKYQPVYDCMHFQVNENLFDLILNQIFYKIFFQIKYSNPSVILEISVSVMSDLICAMIIIMIFHWVFRSSIFNWKIEIKAGASF